MIYCYTGAPGSGKSANLARLIYRWLKSGKETLIISNVQIKEGIEGLDYDRYVYLDDTQVNPKYIVEVANQYWGDHTASSVEDAEERIKVIIDEGQLYFNSRSWKSNLENKWVWFFSIHRHFGITIFICTQYIKALDKQVQEMIEYEVMHRKLSNYGLVGMIIALFTKRLFQTITIWRPIKKVVDNEFFIMKSKYTDIYDTHRIFDIDGSYNAVRIV